MTLILNDFVNFYLELDNVIACEKATNGITKRPFDLQKNAWLITKKLKDFILDTDNASAPKIITNEIILRHAE